MNRFKTNVGINPQHAIGGTPGVIQSANKSTDASNAQAVQVALKSCYAEVTAGTMKINATTGVKDESTPATADTLTVDAALKDAQGRITK